MKFNLDCARDILLYLESLPFGKTTTVQLLSNVLSQYEHDEVVYSCLKLYEANFITAQPIKAIGYTTIQLRTVQDITFAGHEFLNSVREKTIWDKTKSIAKIIGASSLKVTANIAESVIADKLKSLF